MFVNRDFNRTEHDDWVLNIKPKLSEFSEAVPIQHEGKLIGWKVQTRYE